MSKTQIPTNGLADNAVVTGKITDGTIATGDIADDAVTVAKATGFGKVLQIVYKQYNTSTGANNQDTETANFEQAITPSSTSSDIICLCHIAGIVNGGSGRMTSKIRHQTTSGGVTGTEVAVAQVAQDSIDTAGMSTVVHMVKFSPSTTSAVYVKNTMSKSDNGTQWYAQRYSTESEMILLEVQ